MNKAVLDEVTATSRALIAAAEDLVARSREIYENSRRTRAARSAPREPAGTQPPAGLGETRNNDRS